MKPYISLDYKINNMRKQVLYYSSSFDIFGPSWSTVEVPTICLVISVGLRLCVLTFIIFSFVSAKRFDTDLTPRKASIKLIIQEELTKLADEADDEDEDEPEKTEKQASGKGVKA